MTWIALATPGFRRFAPRGLGMDRGERALVSRTDSAEMTMGTLMIETRITGEDRPEQLVGYHHKGLPAAREFRIKSIPGGGITLVHSHGRDLRHTSLQHGGADRTDRLRISYAWNHHEGLARLTIERPGRSRISTVMLEETAPMLVRDLHDMFMTRAPLPACLDFVALSTRVEPIGPCPSLTAKVPVATGRGYVAVDTLRRGNTVLGPGQTLIPVLHALRRTVPAFGSFRPVRLRAPYFGLKQDIIVGATQRLIIGGSVVEYTFGRESVLVPAGHLVNGTAAVHENAGPLIAYHQLILPQNEPLDLAGTLGESQYIGRIRRKPEHLAGSLLNTLPSRTLPEHGKTIHKVLDGFAAITLAEARAA